MSGFHCGQERKLQKQAGYICADRFLPILKIRLQTSGGPYNSHSFDDCFLYKKGEANSLTHRINDLGWAKLKCRSGPQGLAKSNWRRPAADISRWLRSKGLRAKEPIRSAPHARSAD